MATTEQELKYWKDREQAILISIHNLEFTILPKDLVIELKQKLCEEYNNCEQMIMQLEHDVEKYCIPVLG